MRISDWSSDVCSSDLSGTKQRFMAVIGVKAWGDFTEEKMLADLASLNFEYMLYHHIEPLNRAKATTTLDMNYRLARTTLITETAQEQFGAVYEIVAGGAEDSQVLCNYGLNILVEAATEEELDKRISQIKTIAARSEETTVREGAVSKADWAS